MASNDSRARELTDCQRRWLAHLQAWQAQDELGLKGYAELHGLSVSALYTAKRWFKRHGIWQGREVSSTRPRKSRPRLVPVQLSGALGAPTGGIYRVHLRGGVMVEVPEQAESSSTQRLLSTLMEMAS